VKDSPIGTSGSSTIPQANSRRPPARAVRLLLPVWGYNYVKQFLEFSLPTMLAPGNVPALASTLPCTFVLLTSTADADSIAEHPGYRFLSTICDTELQLIDDLITGDNYSTTITLAYERAVRATGSDMRDTCFFFLISDYLVADGSFKNALSRVLAGASGVLAGNFQIIHEDAAPEFHAMFEQDGPDLKIPARELMSWALEHLHPMTAANMVNFPLSHSAHTNRLFWRVDQDTLIGRFYLMHMICIRPEIEDFVIGSSCDYSFIPEMCPSGAVEALTDSDEYLVVEMQPREHEQGFLRIGAFFPAALAHSLSEWTTARHRENARSTLVFHAKDVPPSLPDFLGEADRFIESIGERLSRTPQPHRDHPYWLGAIAAHRSSLKRLRRERAATAAEPAEEHTGWSLPHLIQELKILVFGRPPHVHLWHPRWPDYRVLLDTLHGLLAPKAGTLLVVGRNTIYLKNWISELTADAKILQTAELLDLDREDYSASLKSFQGSIVFVNEGELRLCAPLVERILPLLAEGGFLMLTITNGHATAINDSFAQNFAFWSTQFVNVHGCVSSAEFVPVTERQATLLRWFAKLSKFVSDYPVLAPLLALPVALLTLASYVINRAKNKRDAGRSGIYSSVFMVFRPVGWSRLPKFKEQGTGYWERKQINRPRAEPKIRAAPRL
jgi:hypothetical protein